MSNEIATKKAEPNGALDRPMDNPFGDKAVAADGQDVALIATDGHTDGYAEEEGLPSWFDPTNFSLTAGIGYSLYKMGMSRTFGSGTADEETFGLHNNRMSSYAQADQFATKLAVAYKPFVPGIVSLGIFTGYQAIPSIGGHALQAGLGLTVDQSDKLSFDVSSYYSHLWAKDVETTAISGEPVSDEVLSEILPDELDLHGVGIGVSIDYGLTEYFKIGAYVDVNYYISTPSEPEDEVICITPGIQGTVDF